MSTAQAWAEVSEPQCAVAGGEPRVGEADKGAGGSQGDCLEEAEVCWIPWRFFWSL